MPIREADPRQMQYFEHADCPPGVNIPTEDRDAWEWNAVYRWVYNKITIAKSQGLDAGPHGTAPPFPCSRSRTLTRSVKAISGAERVRPRRVSPQA